MGNEASQNSNNHTLSQNLTTLSPKQIQKQPIFTSKNNQIDEIENAASLKREEKLESKGLESQFQPEKQVRQKYQTSENPVKTTDINQNLSSFQNEDNYESTSQEQAISQTINIKNENNNINITDQDSQSEDFRYSQEQLEEGQQNKEGSTQNQISPSKQENEIKTDQEDCYSQSQESKDELNTKDLDIEDNIDIETQNQELQENSQKKKVQKKGSFRQQDTQQSQDQKYDIFNIQVKSESVQFSQESINSLKKDYQTILQKLNKIEDQINKQQTSTTIQNLLQKSQTTKSKARKSYIQPIYQNNHRFQQRENQIFSQYQIDRREKKNPPTQQNQIFIPRQIVQLNNKPNDYFQEEDSINHNDEGQQNIIFNMHQEESESKQKHKFQLKQPNQIKSLNHIQIDLSVPHVTVNLGLSQAKTALNSRIQTECEEIIQKEDMQRVRDHRNLLSSPIELEVKIQKKNNSQQNKKEYLRRT